MCAVPSHDPEIHLFVITIFIVFFLLPKKKAQHYSWGQKSTQRQCWSFQADNAVCKLSGQKCNNKASSQGRPAVCHSVRADIGKSEQNQSSLFSSMRASFLTEGRREWGVL